MTEALISQFLNYLSYQRKYSQHSIVSYGTDLFQFEIYLKEYQEIDSLLLSKREHVRSWLSQLNSKGLSANTIKRKVSSLKSFFNFLMRESLIEINPAARIATPKSPKRLPVFVSQKEINQVLDTRKVGNLFNDILVTTVIASLYHTGMRLSECINLKEENVDLSRKTIKVLGKRNKERYIPITEELQELFKEYIFQKKMNNISSVFLFCTSKRSKLYPEFVYRKVKAVLSEQTRTKKNSPHVLRHSIATHLLHNGADLNSIKELLGHSQLAATQIYTHNNIEELIKTYKQTHPKS
jgi:integrase/recombinase XerC